MSEPAGEVGKEGKETMAKGFVEIETLAALQRHLQAMPEGTTCDILPSDLEAGNFDIAHFVLPSGLEGDVKYIGPVAEGYVSPFETRPGVLKEQYQ